MTDTAPAAAAGGAEPRPVADVDDALRSTLRGYHRGRWLAIAAVIALLASAVIILGVLYVRQDAEVRASCKFWRLLAPLPVTATTVQRQPTKLSVTLITDAREAYAGQGCGPLPPADPSLLHWAAYYKIRVP